MQAGGQTQADDAREGESEAVHALNTDEELYARFLSGEDDALRLLMERYLERLILFYFTFLQSAAEAEEAAMDAFAVVAMKRSVWHGGSFRRWLYRIARNLSVSRYRKRRFIQVSFDDSHGLTAASAEAEFYRQEEAAAREALLMRLPDGEREVLLLLYREGMRYAQVAEALHMDKKRADNLAYRGKKRLRQWLKEEMAHE